MNAYVSSQKIDLIHWITELNDPSILAQVNAIKDDVLTPTYAEMKSIERGLNDFQRGNTISHTQVKKRYEKWL